MTPPAPHDGPDSTLVVTATDSGRRLDEFLATTLAIGRRAAIRLAARARVNGRRARKGDRVRDGDVVLVPPSDVATDSPLDATLVVVRETRDVLVLDKPAGLPTVALRGAGGDSLAARIARRFPECATVGGAGEAGLVHRLDTGTSGLLLAARTPDAWAALRAQFRRHAVTKEYLALVSGRLDRTLRIDAPIGQHRASVRRMRAVAAPEAARRYAARDACTEVSPERLLPTATVVRARTSTGARHQIRVHLASVGHALLGDPLYGERNASGDEGFLLHASRVEWTDPTTDLPMIDEASLPQAWQERLARLADDEPTAPRAGGEAR